MPEQAPPDANPANSYANAPPSDAAPPAGPAYPEYPPAETTAAPAEQYRGPAADPGLARRIATGELEFEFKCGLWRHDGCRAAGVGIGAIGNGPAQLSGWYDDPRLSPTEQQQLSQLLDQVAGTVVYSTQHLLEPPYEVQPGERLEDISQRLQRSLAAVGQDQRHRRSAIATSRRAVEGDARSIQGRGQPGEARADAVAGRRIVRRPVSDRPGAEHPPVEGTYAVSDKVVNPVYHGRDRAIAADDANNPLGERWIGLGSELGIHGTDRPENIGRTDLAGSISLSPRNAEDVYDILSVGSKVMIRR